MGQMISTFVAQPSSAVKESPNWLEMPHELMACILQRLGSKELMLTQNVCKTWQRICRDPANWKVIYMRNSSEDRPYAYDTDEQLEKLTKQAVDLSRGELIDISIDCFGTDDLLVHIVLRSSKLKRLCLINCYDITGRGLSWAVRRVPQLEVLRLTCISINAKDIEVIGQNCPQLKSFKMTREIKGTSSNCDDNAFAIANNMPKLCCLELFDKEMTNNGLQAILDGCPHLQSLDVRGCRNLDLGGKLGKLCTEQIKNFKHNLNILKWAPSSNASRITRLRLV